MPTEIGPLAAALAKAQAAFPTITRDKEVKVTSARTGKSYTFKYAPLESILNAVRGPLSDNGLVLVQMLDEGALVTTLLHESGASIGGRVDLPPTEDIQGLGSAVTYLRRYAIQAMLGIAAEEDDDGNRASGNQAEPIRVPPVEETDDGGLIGRAEVGKSNDSDFELRQEPDGWRLGFRLVSNGRGGGIKVIAKDALAEAIATLKADVIDKRVIVWGRVKDETFTPKNAKRPVTYQVLQLERIQTPDFVLPAVSVAPGASGEPVVPVAPGQETLPLTDDEKAAIAGTMA